LLHVGLWLSVLVVMTPGAALAQASARQVVNVLALARAGKAPEAWAAWRLLPDGPAKTRLGSELAAATGDLAAALEFYDTLTSAGQQLDRPLLSTIALAAATSLADGRESRAHADIRGLACGAALEIDPGHAPCRTALDALVASSRQADRAVAVFALASAGSRPSPAVFDAVVRNLSKPQRLQFARTATGLPPAERLALIQPLLSDPDIALRYEAAIALMTIPGPEVVAALRALPATGVTAPVRTIALAQRRDADSLAALPGLVGSLSGYLKVQAGKALVDVPDPLGVAILEEMLTSPLGIDRLNAAEALVTTNRDRAWQLIRDLIENGSPVTRPAALQIAGRVGLGTDRVVYRRLLDADPESRGQAVAAIARTLSGSVPLGVSAPGPAPQ
jgi:HEAT repeat protein